MAALTAASPGALALPPAYTPPSDDTVLELVSVPRLPGTAPLAELRAQWQQQTNFLPAALAYAEAALALGAREDDPRFIGYAESALHVWWARPNPPPEIRLMRASTAMARHEYSNAARDLDALIAAQLPESLQARLMRATLHLTQGEPESALAQCSALQGHVGALVSRTCQAAAQALLGDAVASLKELREALPQSSEASLAAQLWALTQAADIAQRLGDDRAAQAFFEDSLQRCERAGHRDPGLLASYADLMLRLGQPQTVIAKLKGLDRLDGLLLRQAQAEQALASKGDAEAGARATLATQMLSERIAELERVNDRSHLREEALFALSLKPEPTRALQLAQQNWQTQREPIDARLLLAAALAAHDPEAARPVVRWMQLTRLQDVRLQALLRQLPAEITATPP